MPEASCHGTDHPLYKGCRVVAPRLCGVVTPNEITLLGILPAIVAVFGVCLRQPALAVTGITLRHVADCLDGTVARVCAQRSELGRQLDHWTDVTFTVAMGLAFLWTYRVPIWACAILGAGAVTVGRHLWVRWASVDAHTDAVQDNLLLVVLSAYAVAYAGGEWSLALAGARLSHTPTVKP